MAKEGDFLFFFSSGSHFVQGSRTICAILGEGIIRNISVKSFKFGPVVQEMSLKGISYLQLWQPFCAAEQKHLCKIAREHCVKLFLIWTSGGDVKYYVLVLYE